MPARLPSQTPARRRLLGVLAPALALVLAHGASAAELPATPEDSPRFLGAKARYEAAQAKYRAADAARTAARQTDLSSPEARAAANELRDVDLALDALGYAPGPKSRPPEENVQKILPLLERRRQAKAALERFENRPAREAADAAAAAAFHERNETHAAMNVLRRDLETVQRARRERAAATVAVTAREMIAAPDQYAGKWVRVLDATFVRREADVQTPVTGQVLSTKEGTLASAARKDGILGRWNRLACLDPAGTPLPEAYEQFYSSGDQPVRPGGTVDLYGRVVRLGDDKRVVFLCDRVVPHGVWSGPPAPGFDARAVGGDPQTRPATRSR